MANLQERRDKSGKLISYSIRVHRGRGLDGKQLKPYTTTFEVQPSWSEKTARKKAEAFAATFEKLCKEGLASDTRQTFAEYCNYVLELKESRGTKHSTIYRYRQLTSRIYPEIGHIKIKDLRVDHLNSLYTKLGRQGNGSGKTYALAKVELSPILKQRRITQKALSDDAQLSLYSVTNAVRGHSVSPEVAEAICSSLNLELSKTFTITKESSTLSAKTVIEHHRLISLVLAQAARENLITYNVASKATLPKAIQKKVNYFQPEQVHAIADALEQEPIKWQAITHLFLITGARRGEILGLKWDKIDFDSCKIHICNSVLYSPDIGLYEETPKTEKSVRTITVPKETMQLLKVYRSWQAEQIKLQEDYQHKGFVFSQANGQPMHPDSIVSWLSRFSKRHSLPHINAHAFRHTMASMLYYKGMDSVSISKRLGHAQVSTTANIYAHVIEDADQKNSDILADIFIKKQDF